jgi:hypothetical protein
MNRRRGPSLIRSRHNPRRSVFQNLSISGRWQYDQSRYVLALGVTALIPGVTAGQTENFVIEFYGWKDGCVLLGRDAKTVTHTVAAVTGE